MQVCWFGVTGIPWHLDGSKEICVKEWGKSWVFGELDWLMSGWNGAFRAVLARFFPVSAVNPADSAATSSARFALVVRAESTQGTITLVIAIKCNMALAVFIVIC